MGFSGAAQKKLELEDSDTKQKQKRVPQNQTRAVPLTSDPMRNQIIMDYAPLIKYIAQKIAARLPSNIDLDDLFSAGVIGLMDAIDKYDPSRDNKFKTPIHYSLSNKNINTEILKYLIKKKFQKSVPNQPKSI